MHRFSFIIVLSCLDLDWVWEFTKEWEAILADFVIILTKSCYFFISFKSLKIIKLRHSTLFFILFHHNFLSIINGHWQTFDFVECSKCMFKSNFYIYSVKKSWCCHYNFTFSDDHCVVEDFHWIACWPWSSRIRWCPAVRVRSSVVQH